MHETSDGVIVPPYRPYESAWSWLHKFSDRNAASAAEIRRIVGEPEPHVWSGGARDLRTSGHWDLNRLAQWWGRPAEEGFVGAYLGATPTHLWDVMTWDVVRYCPDCIAKGYHTPLFQVRGMERCPMHGVMLHAGCPACQAPIPYRWTSACVKATYGCPTCGHSLWPDQRTARCRIAPETNSDDTAVRIHAVWQWIQLSRTHWVGEWGGLQPNPETEMHPADERGLMTFWSAVIPPPDDFLSARSHPLRRSEWGAAHTAHWPFEDGYQERRDALRALYKAFARQWRRRILRHHRDCIRAATRLQIMPASDTEWYNTPPTCPWAFAYILWRMYWDATDDARDVDRYPLRRRNPPGCPGPGSVFWQYWEPWVGDRPQDRVARWWALHEASLMFWSTWRECLALARIYQDANCMVWDPVWVEGRLVPRYWKARTTQSVNFYWWSSAEAEVAPTLSSANEHRKESLRQIERIHRTWGDRVRSHNLFGDLIKRDSSS